MKTKYRFSTKVIFQNKKYSIEEYLNNNTGKLGIVLVKDETFTEWVTFYENGEIGLDSPEMFPKYIKEKLYKIAKNYI